MNRLPAVVVVGVVVLSGCTSGRLYDRRAQIRMSNAAAHRLAGMPLVEVVVDSDSQWPVETGRPCAPVLKRYPATMVRSGEFEVLTPAGADADAVEALLSTFACQRGWAAVSLGAPVAGTDGQVTRKATYASLVPELKAAFGPSPALARAKEPGCALPVYRTAQASQPSVEVVTLFLASRDDQPAAQRRLQEHACALGADALIVNQEVYDLPEWVPVGVGWTAGPPLLGGTMPAAAPMLVPQPTTRVTATAVRFRAPAPRAAPLPRSSEL